MNPVNKSGKDKCSVRLYTIQKGFVFFFQYVNGDHLKRSLKTVITYAETDHELKNTNFPEQVR